MKVSYWRGAKIQLRAPKPEDIHIFKNLDDDILKTLIQSLSLGQISKLKNG